MSKAKVYPCLWFDKNAEEAANFYVSLVPDSRIDKVWRSPADNPSTNEGDVPLEGDTGGAEDSAASVSGSTCSTTW